MGAYSLHRLPNFLGSELVLFKKIKYQNKRKVPKVTSLINFAINYPCCKHTKLPNTSEGAMMESIANNCRHSMMKNPEGKSLLKEILHELHYFVYF